MQEESIPVSVQCDELKWVGFKEQKPLWATHHRKCCLPPTPLAEFNIKRSLKKSLVGLTN